MSNNNDGEVVDLAEVRAAPVPGVVGLLEVYLERARAGELRSVAIAGAMVGQTTLSGYELGDQVAADLCLALLARIREVFGGDACAAVGALLDEVDPLGAWAAAESTR
jgi:hypothetical protein